MDRPVSSGNLLSISASIYPRIEEISLCEKTRMEDWPRWPQFPSDTAALAHYLSEWETANSGAFAHYAAQHQGTAWEIRVTPAIGQGIGAFVEPWAALGKNLARIPAPYRPHGSLALQITLPQWPESHRALWEASLRSQLQKAFEETSLELSTQYTRDTTGTLWMPPSDSAYPCGEGVYCLPVSAEPKHALQTDTLLEMLSAIGTMGSSPERDLSHYGLVLFIEVPIKHAGDSLAELRHKFHFQMENTTKKHAQQTRAEENPAMTERLAQISSMTFYVMKTDAPGWRFFPVLVAPEMEQALRNPQGLQETYQRIRQHWPK